MLIQVYFYWVYRFFVTSMYWLLLVSNVNVQIYENTLLMSKPVAARDALLWLG